MSTSQSTPSRPAAGRLGLLALTALVVGSMIGGGVFSLPQNMSAGASPGAILIAWGITGVGMLALALVYMRLSTRKPELDAGPYAYARAGFGNFMGFNSAWGYWLSAWLGNVSYAVLIFAALGAFFPMFGEGNTWPAVLGASIVLWLIHGLILRGVRQAAIINVVTTFAKMVPILIFIVVAVVAFDPAIFGTDFWGAGVADAAASGATETMGLGSVITQVSGTMLVTLWVFIGIEGASVESGRAERRRDIGRATVIGFLIALVVYMGISLLSMGIMPQSELAGLPDAASMADVLSYVVGGWGGDLVRLGLVVSVGGALLSWTLFAAEIPFVASKEGIMPRLFSRENAAAAPMASLWITKPAGAVLPDRDAVLGSDLHGAVLHRLDRHPAALCLLGRLCLQALGDRRSLQGRRATRHGHGDRRDRHGLRLLAGLCCRALLPADGGDPLCARHRGLRRGPA